MFFPHLLVKLSIVGSLSDREVAYSTSDLQGLNFEPCVWRELLSQSSHHPQEPVCVQNWPKAGFISFHFQCHIYKLVDHVESKVQESDVQSSTKVSSFYIQLVCGPVT